jgi:8-oxo-dGTP pyrophosphatase MutT (NUDIX family)
VLRCRQKFLLAEHASRRRGKSFVWGLPGGRLRANEKPEAGLRRELAEELRLRAPSAIELGDWWHRGENYRVFGASVPRMVQWFDAQEIRALAWLTYAEVADLADAGLLHKGFELEAITEYQRRFRS